MSRSRANRQQLREFLAKKLAEDEEEDHAEEDDSDEVWATAASIAGDVSDTAMVLYRIWFDKAPAGRISNWVGTGFKVASSYKSVAALYKNIKDINTVGNPYDGLDELNSLSEIEFATHHLGGDVERFDRRKGDSYSVKKVNSHLLVYTVFENLLNKELFVSNYDEFKKLHIQHLWKKSKHGLRVTSDREWSIYNKPIEEQKEVLYYDERFKQQIEHVTLRARRFIECGLPRRIAFWGPPGTGKSTLALLMAQAISPARVLCIPSRVDFNAEELLKMEATSVVIDDIDRQDQQRAFMSYAESLKIPQLLLCSLNTVESVDPALLRSGRFDEIVYVGFPKKEGLDQLHNHMSEQYGIKLPREKLAGIPPAGLKELYHSLSIVGIEYLEGEAQRLKEQANMSSGSKTRGFIARRAVASIHDEWEE